MHSEDDKALQEKNKKRIVKTRAQVEALEKFYNEYKYPTEAMKLKVADSIGLTEKRVSSWFCHRRLKDKMLFNYEKYTIAGKQDRSSGIIQDRGSGYRQDSCSSTEQGDDLTMDTREVGSDRTGSYDRTDSDDPFDPVNSRYSVPKSNARGEKTRAGPSGYLKVKGQVENVDLLPSGASESSTEEPEEVKGKEKASEDSSKEVNSSEEVRPSKKSRKSSSTNPPNHSFFNQSVLDNTDVTIAIQYMQAICPTADRDYLDTLSDEEFTNKYALHTSKFIVYLAHSLARPRNRYNDPKLASELRMIEGLVTLLRSQLYNQSVLENTEATKAMQDVCPTADRNFLNTLSDKEFIKEFVGHASKFIVYLAYSVARARNGQNDPNYALHASKFIVYLAYYLVRAWNGYNDPKLAAELKTTEGKVEAKSKAQEIEEMALRLSDQKAQEVEKVQAAHEEGVLAGRAGYLRSEEGLMMVDRIREVNRESVLHSGDFCRAVVDVTKFYGKYLLGKIKEWVDSGNALEAFSLHNTMKNAPDAPRLLLTEEHQRMERLSAKGLLDYLEAQDRAAYHPDDNQQDADLDTLPEEAEAATGTSKGAPDGDGQSS